MTHRFDLTIRILVTPVLSGLRVSCLETDLVAAGYLPEGKLIQILHDTVKYQCVSGSFRYRPAPSPMEFEWCNRATDEDVTLAHGCTYTATRARAFHVEVEI